jgi:hypothetical protein
MIEKLNSYQENQLKVYRDKWLAKGLSIDRIDRKSATENFIIFNKIILKNKINPMIIFMGSPVTTWLATLLLYNYFYNKDKSQVGSQIRSQIRSQVESQVGSQVWSQVWSQVESQVESQIRSQVWSQVESQVGLQVGSQVGSQVWSQVESQIRSQIRSQVWSQVESQIRSQVGSQIRSQVWSQVESQVWSQIRSQVGLQVGSQIRSQVANFVYPYLNGQFDCGYFSFYDFCNKILKISFSKQKEWDCYLHTSDVSLIYPFKDFIIISEKPTQIKQKNLLLHNETGASIKYADGFEIYSLNGIRVSKEIVMTSAEKLNPKIILTERNTEVRREIVRKIGIERVLQKLGGKILDKKDNYELINIDLGENRIRPYLKMLNPSIGTYHLEGIAPEIKTVEQALNWRNQTDEKPIQLT